MGEDRSICGPMDGLSLVWWVIDIVVWTDSWPSIAGACCSFICVGAGEERARKVLALRGLRGVERQVGSARWNEPSCRTVTSAVRMVSRKARRSRVRFLGWASKPRSSWCKVTAKSLNRARLSRPSRSRRWKAWRAWCLACWGRSLHAGF
jgi:hypothetical protein